MTDLILMEKLLSVLSRIEERLGHLEEQQKLISSPNSVVKDAQSQSSDEEPNVVDGNGSKVAAPPSRSLSEETVEALKPKSIRTYTETDYNELGLIATGKVSKGRGPDPSGGLPDVWTTHLGRLWELPPDGRLCWPFQKHMIKGGNTFELHHKLTQLRAWKITMRDIAFTITDYDRNGRALRYGLPDENHPVDEHKCLGNVFAENELSGLKPSKDWDFTPLGEEHRGEASPALCSAPWRRLITLEGITYSNMTDIHSESDEVIENLAHWTRNPLLGLIGNLSWLQSGDLRLTFNHMLTAHENAEFASPESLANSKDSINCGMGFHFTSYIIIENSTEDLKREKWATGSLYDGATKLVHVAYSVFASVGHETCAASGKIVSLPGRWTIVDLQPRHEPRDPAADGRLVSHLLKIPAFEPKTCTTSFMSIVYASVFKSAVSWSMILLYFDTFLGSGKAFMNPREHDALLVDDGAFTRSRKYFWALSTLSEFDKVLNDTINQWDVSCDIWKDVWPTLDATGWEETRVLMERTNESVDQLRNVRKKLQQHHQETTAMRDGLFNASAVMESRDANKLGENVKLLTLVSIFFLPLAFVTSIFSINNEFFNPFILPWAAAITGIVTYLIVFNLNNIIHLITHHYSLYRSNIIKTMCAEKNASWKARGSKFENFNFRSTGDVKPSEWHVARFVVRNTMRGMGRGVMSIVKVVWLAAKRKGEDQPKEMA